MIKNFSFDKLMPIEISNSFNKIEKSKLYKEKGELKFNKNDFNKSLFKLINNEILSEYDFLVLLCFLEEISKKKYFDIFMYKIFESSFKFTIINKGLSLITKNLYSDVLNKTQKECLYTVLSNHFTCNLDISTHRSLSEKIRNSSNLDNFLKDIKDEISSFKYNIYSNANNASFDSFVRKYNIKLNSEYYFQCLLIYLNNNYLDNNIWKVNEDTIKSLSINKTIKIIKDILSDMYKNKFKIDISYYPDNFFFLVEFLLGEDITSKSWNKITQEEKSIYTTWIKDKSIRKFFNGLSDGGDVARLKFWRQYLDSMRDIFNNEELNNILAMEFDNHIVIEFAERNNATYIYDKNELSMKKVESIALNSYIKNNDKLKFFKNKPYVIGEKNFNYVKKMNHAGFWQPIFERNLQNLGYRKDKY